MPRVEGSHRQRMFRVRAAAAERIGGSADRLALGWTDDVQVVARLRVGRGFAHRTFDVTAEDEPLVSAIVEWVHADSPKTS